MHYGNILQGWLCKRLPTTNVCFLHKKLLSNGKKSYLCISKENMSNE